MKNKTSLCLFVGSLLAAWLATTAQAADLRPDAVSVQAGAGGDGARITGVGLVWDWDFERLRRKAELTGQTELLLNHLQEDDFGGGRQGFTQIVLLPSLRMRLSQGRSPWYFELGIGVSWMDKLLVSPGKTFSTQWNFYDMMGVGYSLDSEHRNELGLRWVHISNAGIKQPNPGRDFLQLRYVARF